MLTRDTTNDLSRVKTMQKMLYLPFFAHFGGHFCPLVILCDSDGTTDTNQDS